MTQPSARPDWQSWPRPSAEAWPAPGVSGTALNIRTEAVIGLLVAAYSAFFGAVLGLAWPRVAPHIDVIRAIQGSEAAAKAVLGDDMWFALLAAAAGVVSVAVVLLAGGEAGRGPGALIGLAAGGVLGSVVAAHVGHQVQQPHILATLHHRAPRLTPRQVTTVLGFFDFKVRAHAVLMAWPLAAVITHGLTVIARYLRLGPEV